MKLARLFGIALMLLATATPTFARDRLTVALQLEPPALDPTSGASAAIDDVTFHTIFEGLTTLDATGAAKPLLALRWRMAADARSYLFQLRPGVRFHDGTPFDARAAAFSLRRAIVPGSTNALAERLSGIVGIDVLGPLTLRIRLAAPDAELATILARGDCAMVSPRSVGTLATAPIGTGPFRFAQWRRGDRLTLKRNRAYWGDPPPLARIDFRFIADPAAAYAAARAHAVDLFPAYPAPENLAQLRADPTLRVTTGPSETEVILAINERGGALADLRVRRAIAYAIDRRQVIDGAMYGYGTPIGSHMPPQDPDYVDLTGLYPHDPARARVLLAAAGHARGLDLTLKLPPPSYARRSGEIIAAQLAQVGIRVRIVPVEWAQWLDEVFTRHDFDLSIVAHVEPADYDIYGRRDYYLGYRGDAVRALLTHLRAIADPRLRHALLGDIQRRIAGDAVNGFLFEYPRLSVADAGLRDLWIDTPLQAVDYAHARFNDGAADRADGSGMGGGTRWWPLFLTGAVLLGLALGWSMGMPWLIARAGVMLVTLLVASLLVFALLQLAPGDPAQFMLGVDARPAAVVALREELGLGGGAVARYAHWISGLLHGELGTSYAYRVPVAGLVRERIGVSLPLAALALMLALVLGLGSALAAARRPDGAVDRIAGVTAAIGVAVPNFWLAMLLLMVAALGFGWSSAGGFPGWDGGAWPAVAALGLPAVALGLPQAAILHRVARAAIGEERARDYVRLARAKGLSERAILWRHILPNVWPAVLAIVGLQLPFLVGGAVIVENVFSLPGLGSLALHAIEARDLIVVQAVAMLLVTVTVGASFLVDVAQAIADPRLRRSR